MLLVLNGQNHCISCGLISRYTYDINMNRHNTESLLFDSLFYITSKYSLLRDNVSIILDFHVQVASFIRRSAICDACFVGIAVTLK